MRISFYLPLTLLSAMGGRTKSRQCRCGKPAEFVQAGLFEYVQTRPSIGATWTSCYCGDCIEAVASKRGMEIVTSEGRVREIHQHMCAKMQAAFEKMRQENIERKAKEMASNGRVLVMSGYKGAMFEMADGSLKCELRDGSSAVPCCMEEGARIIDNRVAPRPASVHSNNCPQRQHQIEGIENEGK